MTPVKTGLYAGDAERFRRVDAGQRFALGLPGPNAGLLGVKGLLILLRRGT
jgi:hypothetical protein